MVKEDKIVTARHIWGSYVDSSNDYNNTFHIFIMSEDVIWTLIYMIPLILIVSGLSIWVIYEDDKSNK
jgi:hypothetical protein